MPYKFDLCEEFLADIIYLIIRRDELIVVCTMTFLRVISRKTLSRTFDQTARCFCFATNDTE